MIMHSRPGQDQVLPRGPRPYRPPPTGPQVFPDPIATANRTPRPNLKHAPSHDLPLASARSRSSSESSAPPRDPTAPRQWARSPSPLPTTPLLSSGPITGVLLPSSPKAWPTGRSTQPDTDREPRDRRWAPPSAGSRPATGTLEQYGPPRPNKNHDIKPVHQPDRGRMTCNNSPAPRPGRRGQLTWYPVVQRSWKTAATARGKPGSAAPCLLARTSAYDRTKPFAYSQRPQKPHR